MPPTTVYFYPDRHPETSSVDGYVRRQKYGTYDSVRNGAGTEAYDQGAVYVNLNTTTTPYWFGLYRAIMLFDTTAIPPGAGSKITEGKVRLWCITKGNSFATAPTFVIVSSSPNTDTALIAADYGSLGVAPLSDIIAYADIPEAAYYTYTLNAAGLLAITKGGVTRLGLRMYNWDVLSTPPVYGVDKIMTLHNADSDVSYKFHGPRLEVTYTVGAPRSRGFIIN